MLPDKTPLRHWRRRLKITQAVAARALGLSRRQVQKYDMGEVEPPRIVDLAMRALEEHPELMTDGRAGIPPAMGDDAAEGSG